MITQTSKDVNTENKTAKNKKILTTKIISLVILLNDGMSRPFIWTTQNFITKLYNPQVQNLKVIMHVICSKEILQTLHKDRGSVIIKK